MSRANDFYYDYNDLESALETAEDLAKSDREIEFVSSMRESFEEWGLRMFMSDKQYDWLERIASGN